MPSPPPDYCAIDFGTSNSAIAIPHGEGMRLVTLEGEQRTMPTAVFYFAEFEGEPLHPGAEQPKAFGRAAVAAYVDGFEGRLMRSMKSILGSRLVDQTTDVGAGRAVKYLDVITGYLRHLKSRAEAEAGRPLHRAVLGRPVFFVDDDPQRDAQAQASLASAAHAVGFSDIAFQYEPIAAAFDYEAQAVKRGVKEQLVLVADIGGGTSDFSVVRVGSLHAARLDRRADILANHGVHIAGTDFDRRVELTSVLRELGFRALGPSRPGSAPREVPSAVYFDLATWHLINTVYSPQRVSELKGMASFYGNPVHHQRLMTVIAQRLGHELAARAEDAKIAVAAGGRHVVDLSSVERGLNVALTKEQAVRAIDGDLERIVDAARATVRDAGVDASRIGALYFTGGSTGMLALTERLEAAFAHAKPVRGDRLASVATGLGLYAARLLGQQG